jgi:glycogen debranching enzyme
VQGFVFDAKLRTAELARAVWDDAGLAERLELEAEALGRRFQEHFWIEQRGGYYALALDHDKKPVDAMCSNMGQLLWSGIVPAERVDTVVAQLVGNALWSGWGIRTMSREDAAYNPIGYHTGTVWPHDVSLIAWGLARCGRRAELEQVARAMLEAASGLDGQLPEVFSGLSRAESPFPVDYPTAARPQAWAAATPILLLRLVLGLEPDPSARALTSRAPSVPSWLGDIELSVQAFGSEWEVKTRSGSLHLGEPG